MKKIGILNLGINNIKSITNACKLFGKTNIINSYKDFNSDTEILILPGNGHFSVGMQSIKELKFDQIIYEFITKKKKIIGICLGLQLLMNKSDEAINIKGLSLIDGEVKKIDPKKIKIPLLGWYTVNFKNKLIEKKEFFFNNSYMVQPEDKNIIVGKIGEVVPAYIVQENIHGFQFHPEKSSFNGLKLLESTINN
tara:strand:+ start:108 stop:692 length:585 start_codon:yes stop_codon:yes gene_type:complete